MILTETQARALSIIKNDEPRRPAEFARLMWPDAEAWVRPAKCGQYGVSRGGGMRMAGGAYLAKLRKAGLITSPPSGSGYRYMLTPDGQRLLAERLAPASIEATAHVAP